jgi:sugar phosphate isomerase/epimerase
MKKIGLTHVHLAVGPALEEGGDKYLEAVKAQDWTISSTMIGFPQEDYSTLETIKVTGGVAPDEHWEANRKLAEGAVKVTAELGVPFLSMHAGFIDHTQPEYARKFYDRIQCLADAAGDSGIMLLMETGQETAEDLRHFLVDMNHPALGVNYDPANMILYNQGNPINAVKTLVSWIKHVHIKDANHTMQSGTWGEEVPWGDGEVGPDAFLGALKEIGFDGTLAIEREAGDDRFNDIKRAAERLNG